MALVISKALREGASGVCFEVVNNGAEESGTTVIDVASLSGAGDLDNHEILITRVVASVVSSAAGTPALTTLSWGDGTDFLHLGAGTTDLNITFQTPNASGSNNADVTVTCAENVLFTLRIFAKKMVGYPTSMGHSKHRP